MTKKAALRIELSTFDAAHQIPTHSGKCQNLHGHTYHVFIEVEGEISEDKADSGYGMVVDFGIIKTIYKDQIHSALDHAFLLGGDVPKWFLALQDLALKSNKKVTDFEGLKKVAYLPIPTTTAEHLARWIGEKMLTHLAIASGPSTQFHVTKVEVWETPTSCGIWVPGY